MKEHKLTRVEKALSDAWGGEVRLSFLEQLEEHEHITRFAVQKAPPDAPATVILKRWREEGEERFNPEFSASHFFNEWAALEFLSQVLGAASPAPQVYVGDQKTGFIVTEDLGGQAPLHEALWRGNASQATEVLVRYGELLGWLHRNTVGYGETFAKVRQRLCGDHPPQMQEYLDFFQESVETLESLAFPVPSLARDDIRQAAGILSQPGQFAAFTHGDPVFNNILEWRGRWRLIDFEAASFRHAVWEGAFLRMLFPTSGLRFVLQIPEDVWRRAELAYRAALCEFCPVAGDDALYGQAMTAACVFWVLNFCSGWMTRACEGDAPLEMVNRVRQSAIARFEMLVHTTREFQSMQSLGDFFEELVSECRSQWPAEACELPLYPAFLSQEE